MTLNRTYRRDFKTNASFYVFIILLTVIAVVIDIAMAGATRGEEKYVNKIFSECNVEEASFTTYNEIGSSDIDELEKKYDVCIEEQQYIDCASGEDKIRIMKTNEKVNKYLVVDGHDITAANQILLTKGYANANDLKIGDTIRVNDQEYEICGFALRPDYLYPIENISDNASSPKTFGIAFVANESFESLKDADKVSYYSMTFQKDNENEVRKELYQKFMTSSYTRQDANLRITTLNQNIAIMKPMVYEILPMILLFIILIVAVVIGRKIKEEQKTIGVLYANGYRRSEISFHYSIVGIITGLIGSLLGIGISLPMVRIAADAFFYKFEPLPADYQVEPLDFLIALLAPALMYFIAIYLVSFVILRKDVVEMLRDTSSKKTKNLFRMEKSRLSINAKIRIRAIFGNLSRTILVVVGVAIASILIVMALSSKDSLDVYTKDVVDKMGSFEYEYFLNQVDVGKPEQGEAMLSVSFETKDTGKSISFIGLDNDNTYINIKMEDGKEADLSGDKYYITSMGAQILKVKTGDKIQFVNETSMEEHTVSIAGIVDNDSQSVVYASREAIAGMLDLPGDSYNAVVSDKGLDYSGNELLMTVTKDSMRDQVNYVNEMMWGLLVMMMIFGIILCIVVVYLMVNMIISESKSQISLLSVLGYNQREISKMVIYVYHFLIPIGIVLGLVLGLAMTKQMYADDVEVINTYIKVTITPVSVIEFVLIVLASYAVSMFMLSRKIGKAEPTDCLKENIE